MSTHSRFTTFINNLSLTEIQNKNGREATESIISCLNRHYWGTSSPSQNRLLVGSWGKFTRVRPPRDVDVVFSLPWSVHTRFSTRTGNIQSQILQEVRSVLLDTFPNTNVRGSGPVVMVPHYKFMVEVIPSFYLDGSTKTYMLCKTANNGSWLYSDYQAELDSVKTSNHLSDGNTRHLVKMLKQWQRHCNVPMKSFWLELLAITFKRDWPNRGKGAAFYDWMIRDFFRFLVTKSYSTIYSPGTFEAMNIGGLWLTKAETALRNAETACERETSNEPIAYLYWRDVFGVEYPS